MGWTDGDFRKFAHLAHLGHPREDYFQVSGAYPIFAVADGVTLIQYILEKKEYPSPSPAGEVARMFCKEVIHEAEKRYENFSETDIKEIFRIANDAVGKYNLANGRSPENLDYWFNDLYAATGAFAIIKNGNVYWASICDSYIAHFDNNGTLKFKSPACNSLAEAKPSAFKGNRNDPREKVMYTWRFLRNSMNEAGQRTGYGVITGESEASSYFSYGRLEMNGGDLLVIFTDGFEEFFKLPDFIALLNEWPENIEFRIKEFTKGKAEEDPDKFGRERTLIACKV